MMMFNLFRPPQPSQPTVGIRSQQHEQRQQPPSDRPGDAAARDIVRNLETIFQIRGDDEAEDNEAHEAKRREEEDALVMNAALCIREKYTSEDEILPVGDSNEEDFHRRLDERRRRILSEISNSGMLNRALNRVIGLLRKARRMGTSSSSSLANFNNNTGEERARDVFLQTVLELLIDAANGGNASRILLHSPATTTTTASSSLAKPTSSPPLDHALEMDEPRNVVEALMELLKGENDGTTTSRWIVLCAIQVLGCLMRELPDQTSDLLLRVPASLETCVEILNLEETVVEIKREMVVFLEMLTRSNPQATLFLAFCDGLEAVMRLAMMYQRDRGMKRLAARIVLNTVENNPKGKRLLCENPHLVRSLCGMIEEEDDEEDDDNESGAEEADWEDAGVIAIRVLRCAMMMRKEGEEKCARFSHFDRYLSQLVTRKNERGESEGVDEEHAVASQCAASLLSIRGKDHLGGGKDHLSPPFPIVVMSLQRCAGVREESSSSSTSNNNKRLTARSLERRREAMRALGEILRWDARLLLLPPRHSSSTATMRGKESCFVNFLQSSGLRELTEATIDRQRWIDVEPLAYLWSNLCSPPGEIDPVLEALRRMTAPNASEYDVDGVVATNDGGGECAITWLGRELLRACEAVSGLHDAVYVEPARILEIRTRIYRRFRLWEMVLAPGGGEELGSRRTTTSSCTTAQLRRELATKVVVVVDGGEGLFSSLFSKERGILSLLVSQTAGENESGAVGACRAGCVKELLRCLCIWCGEASSTPSVMARKMGALETMSSVVNGSGSEDEEIAVLVGLAKFVMTPESQTTGGDATMQTLLERRKKKEWIDDECLEEVVFCRDDDVLMAMTFKGNVVVAPKGGDLLLHDDDVPTCSSSTALTPAIPVEAEARKVVNERSNDAAMKELEKKYRELLRVVAKQEVEREFLTEALRRVGGEESVREVERRLGAVMSSRGGVPE